MGKYTGKFVSKEEKRAPLPKILPLLLVVILVIAAVCFVLKGMNRRTEPVQMEQVLPTELVTTPVETEAPAMETTAETQPAEATLAKLHLKGDISQMLEKSDERIVAFTYEDNFGITDGYLKMTIQDTSSLDSEKKNYTINLYRDQACAEKLEMDLGWGVASQYGLDANWNDKTHARNIVTARIASQVQEKYNVLPETPNQGLIDGFPVEIYNNDEFLGLYTLNIPKDAWLLNMDGNNPNHIMLHGVALDDVTFFWNYPNLTSWEVEVGEANDETLGKLTRLYNFVLTSTNDEFKEHIHEYINLDATLNYYLMADMAFLGDNLGNNMLLFTYDGEVWYPGLYDLGASWGTCPDGKTLYDYETEGAIMLDTNILFMRMEDCFGQELVDRYHELRNEIFTKEYILSELYAFKDQIPEDVFSGEALRWGEEISGYDYDQIEEYLDYRIPALDGKYSDWNGWIVNRESRFMALFQMLAEYGVLPENFEFPAMS